MLKVKKDNVVYSIDEGKKDLYLQDGYDVVDASNEIIERGFKTYNNSDVKNLLSEIDKLKAENKKLKTKNKEVKANVKDGNEPTADESGTDTDGIN